ncbi:MAG TPA: N-acetyl-gamma-glutamyl-phosphate reductase [Tepidisphaeraceae bacterium]|jgi:N-acetyl-gamma-glutamyl-phosphate reductase|nr:N-acetyl-gamma-glutamyl-phosphate reductase [Tepidisphaeraceae bacterium]
MALTQHYRIGIVGVSGYGGGETLRLCANHPQFDIAYVAGESSAGQKIIDRFPGIPSAAGGVGELTIQKWNPADLPALEVLFISLPSGESKSAASKLPANLRIVDIGSDHRWAEGWQYGVPDLWPEQIRKAKRVASPGCYPSAALPALAPLLAHKLIDSADIIIDAKSGVSGAGRGGGNTLGYAEVNEDVSAYSLFKHGHVPEMNAALSKLAGTSVSVTFTPHLVPMTRGILATCYARGTATADECRAAARDFYAGRPFVRVTDAAPHTKWAYGSNLVFVGYATDPASRRVIALGAVDNLVKGAAGQAVQNANLMLGLDETTGLTGVPLWP